MTRDDVDFETWLNELRNVAIVKYAFPTNFSFADPCWRIPYDDDMTPEEAMALEMSYADPE